MLRLIVDAAGSTALFFALAAAALAPLEWHTGRRARRTGVAALLGLVAINALVAEAVAARLAAWHPGLFDPRAVPDWPRLALALVLAEVGAYWLHRWMHASETLWRFHRVHHRPGRLWWLEAWRMHPVDAFLHVIVGVVPALLLDAPLGAHATVLLARKLYTGLLHADSRWSMSRVDRVLATPGFHHRHHDDGPVGNFAGLLAILDVLFGTWRPERARDQ